LRYLHRHMHISAFDYNLPPERIATSPARPRDSARLLQIGATLRDSVVSALPSHLRAGDVLVVNDTRVIPAQLTAMRGAARIGITLDREIAPRLWRCLLRNARRVAAGDELAIDEGFSATVLAVLPGGVGELAFNTEDFAAALSRAGALALPPYIARPRGVTDVDATDYQTMFAAHEGAVAAPTAGLHFTPELVAALTDRGIGIVRVTLHVGAGTFLPVRVDDVREHRMHAERGFITADTADAINRARAAGGRVIAVGTTALRLLETAADAHGTLHAFTGDTDIFILPGYRFKIVDLLLTNFHLPRSTLLMLVSAFAGADRIRAGYAHAIAAGYRFYSYGDACLLARA
jgi:S-adenosylmethionine:tRNA ribosyltransferase-isomerase